MSYADPKTWHRLPPAARASYGAFLRARQRETSPMMWAALYQQRPAPEEGDFFKAAWLRSYEKLPACETLCVYGASDYAVTADGGDYSVHILVGLDPDARMYVLDVWRKQASSDAWVEFCDLVKDWKPMMWAEEQGQIKAGVGNSSSEATTRAAGFGGPPAIPYARRQVGAGQINPRTHGVGRALLAHQQAMGGTASLRLLSFPAGKYDDQVDALGLIGQLLETIILGEEPRATVPLQRDRYSRRRHLDEEEEITWKVV